MEHLPERSLAEGTEGEWVAASPGTATLLDAEALDLEEAIHASTPGPPAAAPELAEVLGPRAAPPPGAVLIARVRADRPKGDVVWSPAWDEVLAKIRTGHEKREVELKSSLRWSYKGKELSPSIADHVLRTIAAMLNSAGGYLIIGAKDDWTPLGLIPDDFLKEDGTLDHDQWMLHLSDKISTCFGDGLWNNVRAGFAMLEGAEVAVLEVSPSKDPIIATIGGQERLFVRRLNSSVELTLQEAVVYLREHYGRAADE